MIAALEGGEWSATRPGRTLPPGKIRYPFYRRLGGPQGRSGRAENLVPTGIRSRTEGLCEYGALRDILGLREGVIHTVAQWGISLFVVLNKLDNA